MHHFSGPLDPRRLLSTSFVNGVLTVTGTSGDDTITVALSHDGSRVIASLNGVAQSYKHVQRVVANGDDGNDSIAIFINVPTLLHGGNGDDLLSGGGGDDRLYGDSGSDELEGNGGDDLLDGGGGSDLFSGGAGTDVASYASRTADLYVSIKRGDYDDGERGEHDNVRYDVEGIVGGEGDDTLLGYSGNDTIFGGNGNDLIRGDDGTDSLYGDAGDDTLEGNDNNDRLAGGDGDDSLDGGDGRNYLYGNDGDDTLDAHNGGTDDIVDGGEGDDYAKIDQVVKGPNNEDHDNRRDIEHTKWYVYTDDSGDFDF